jgi:AcrR family transcriptional regulator
MAPIVVDKAKKKTDILNAAIEVFATKGVANAKMNDIAIAANIGKGTIYEYFSSKEDIFSTAFHVFFERMSSDLIRLTQSPLQPSEKLYELIQLSFQTILTENASFAGIMMDFWAEAIRNKNKKIEDSVHLTELYESMRVIIAQILEEGIEAGEFIPCNIPETASLIMAVLDGLLLQWIMEPNLFDTNNLGSHIYRFILNALTSGKEL